MSTQYGKLISLILQEHFGEVVEKVGIYLFKNGTSPLGLIVKYTELPIPKVKLALCVLIKQGFVTFKQSRNEVNAEYELISEKVLLILRYPKYVSQTKKLFGEEAEILVEEILINGYGVASDLILKVDKRLKERRGNQKNLPDIRDKFVSLVTAKYLMRHPKPEEEKPVPILKITETEMFLIPNINIGQVAAIRDGKQGDPGDTDIYWCVNFDRFHQDFRDKILVSAITRRFDENAGELMRIMLQQMYIRTEPWADTSNNVPFVEIKNIIKKLNTHNQLTVYLDHYLTVLEDDESKFITKVDDASGGQYVVNLKNAIQQLCWVSLENIVLEKFHTKAARIFRLVKIKKFIEPDQIQQLAMIPGKEAKRLSYQLLEENFLQLQELRRAQSNMAPNKSFTLFHVNLDQVVRMALEICYKALYNAMTRRNHDKQVNKRIIDKKHRVDSIAMSLKVQGAPEDQLLDIEEMITPPEKEMLERIGKVMKTLNLAELEIDETIFLFQLYCVYNKE